MPIFTSHYYVDYLQFINVNSLFMEMKHEAVYIYYTVFVCIGDNPRCPIDNAVTTP